MGLKNKLPVKQDALLVKARSASAPGLNGGPYRVYKSCPMVQKLLWNLMRVTWKTQTIPSEWPEAVTAFIPNRIPVTSTTSEELPY